MVQNMARCKGTGLEGVTPSLIAEPLPTATLSLLTPAVAVNHYCHFFRLSFFWRECQYFGGFVNIMHLKVTRERLALFESLSV